MTIDATLAAPLSAGRARRARRGASAVLAATALLLASCGTGGDDADTSAATTTTAEAATTTEPGGDVTTTTGIDDDGPSDDELEALLPTAADLGPDFREVDDDDDDDSDDGALDAALEEACPDAAEFFADDEGDDGDKIERTFEDDFGREVTVGFDRTPRNLDEESLDRVVEVMNQCDTITAVVDGFDMAIDLTIERDDTYGDRGSVMAMALTMDHPQLAAPIDLGFRARVFVLGSISVMVELADGIDEDAMVSVPADVELLDTLAADLEAGLADLLG